MSACIGNKRYYWDFLSKRAKGHRLTSTGNPSLNDGNFKKKIVLIWFENNKFISLG